MTTTNDKNIATVLHLSSLTQYVIPFGNYIFPIVIWSSKKDESEFVDFSGKQVLNFQLSIFLYTVVLCAIAIPILLFTVFSNISFDALFHNHDLVIHDFNFQHVTGIAVLGIIAGIMLCALKVIEFCLIISAAVRVSNGENYKYPLSIPFFK